MTTSADPSAAAPAPRTDVRLRLSLQTGLYTLSAVAGRLVGFAVVPIVTGHLTPDDYGVLSVASTVVGLLTVLLGCGATAGITYLYLRAGTPAKQREVLSSLWWFSLLAGGAGALVVDRLGMAGYLEFLKGIPFDPYIRLALWWSYFAALLNLPIGMLAAKEQSVRFAVFNLANAIVGASFTVYAVAIRDGGVLGALQANVAAIGLMALVGGAMMIRGLELRISPGVVRAALAFGVPLIPHSIAQWMLSLSDRLILERYVATDALGLYTLGYQVGMLVSVVGTAMGTALGPIMVRMLGDPEQSRQVPAVGTHILVAMAALGMAVGLLAHEWVAMLAPPAYAGAARFVPLIAAASVAQAAYYVWSQGTWYSMRTKVVPLVTIVAGAVNVGLNLWLVRRIGAMAAAIALLVSYCVSAGLHLWLASHRHPIAWEYGRLARAGALVFGWTIVAIGLLELTAWPVGRVLLVAAVVGVGLPASLFVIPYWSDDERRALSSYFNLARQRVANWRG